MERSYNGKSDIWSLGCVLYELAAQRPPFTASEIQGLKKKVVGSDFERIPSSYSNDLDGLIRKCLTKDQNARPSACELLESSLLRQKMKMFPNQFDRGDLADGHGKMMATIRCDPRNFKSIQSKLPKCAYDCSAEKENQGRHVGENSSWVASHKNRSGTLEKLPKIRRSESARRKLPALKMGKEERLPLRRNLMKLR